VGRCINRPLRTHISLQPGQLQPPSTPNVDIYCDGACDPNPGPAGTGLVVYRGGTLEELCYGLHSPHGTNNTAELHGLYQALLIAEAVDEPVRIHSDSTYAINAISTWGYNWKAKGWKTKAGMRPNINIIEPAHELYDQIQDRVQLLHVRGHTGVEGNELADRMAMLAITREETSLVPYDGPYDVRAILKLRAG
jgi:ribonuclease HI